MNDDKEMASDLGQNLRLLCGYYKSISEVSRRLEISRPQFNRYLSGRYRPSAYTLRRICDFFGVEEHEILMPHNQFSQLIHLRPKARQEDPTAEPVCQHFQALQQQSANLDKYLGFYFEYHLSMAAPGKILRNLVKLERQGDGYYYQRTERFIEKHSPESHQTRICHSKYLGTAFFLTDRIFMLDYESLTQNEIVQTILYPTFKNRVTRLQGLRIGAAASGNRIPCSTRVVFDFLGANISVKKALKLCGLFDYDSREIDESIRKAITNEFDEADGMLKGNIN